MNLLMFLAIVAMANANIDTRPYYRTSSQKFDERAETMHFISKKRESLSNIDWDNFDPSSVKDRGPARNARVSALLDKMNTNVVSTSNKIGPYETKSDGNSAEKSFGSDIASNYQTSRKSNMNINSDSDVEKSPKLKYQMENADYGSPKPFSKYPSLNRQESIVKSPNPKQMERYDSYKKDSGNEYPIVRPPAPVSKVNTKTYESISTESSHNGSYASDSGYKPTVVATPPAVTNILIPTYQPASSSYNPYVATPNHVSSSIKPPVPEPKVHVTSPAAFPRPLTPSYQVASPAGIYVNNTERLTEFDRKTSDEKQVESPTKSQATSSFWSNTPENDPEARIIDVKVTSSSDKIPVPIRNSGAGKYVGSSFGKNSEINTPVVEKILSPPLPKADTAKFKENARNLRTTMHMVEQMKLNHGTSNKTSFAGHMGSQDSLRELHTHRDDMNMDGFSSGVIHRRVEPPTFERSYYSFPKIQNKYK